jgi:hypothetical protein
MSLETFIDDSGVQTYEGLVNRCNRLGCQPPTLEEYRVLRPHIVSSPQDGVVVLEPPDVTEESTGRKIDPEAPVTVPEVKVITEKLKKPVVDKKTKVTEPELPDGGSVSPVTTTDPQGSRRGRRKKKESPPTE